MGQHAGAKTEVLAGLDERVTIHNPENGFCVLRLKTRGHCDLVTTIGHAATISAGDWVTASGEWTNDRTHGGQFRARSLKTSAPSSIEDREAPRLGHDPGHRPGLCHAHGQAVR
jgi:exodeoxyribonuclease V alpha subunit